MAKIKPTSKDVRRSYRQDLSGPQQRAFDALGDLIDSPRDDLAWYHNVGELVGRLRPEGHARSVGSQTTASLLQWPRLP